jgi:hypothetical protein
LRQPGGKPYGSPPTTRSSAGPGPCPRSGPTGCATRST